VRVFEVEAYEDHVHLFPYGLLDLELSPDDLDFASTRHPYCELLRRDDCAGGSDSAALNRLEPD
jgi:hypothetical protein